MRRTHVSENTLLSFVTGKCPSLTLPALWLARLVDCSIVAPAANMGAAYIEFDVQLSGDDVPIIHHDYLARLGGGLRIPLRYILAACWRAFWCVLSSPGDSPFLPHATRHTTTNSNMTAAQISALQPRSAMDISSPQHADDEAPSLAARNPPLTIARSASLSSATKHRRSLEALGVDDTSQFRLAKYAKCSLM